MPRSAHSLPDMEKVGRVLGALDFDKQLDLEDPCARVNHEQWILYSISGTRGELRERKDFRQILSVI